MDGFYAMFRVYANGTPRAHSKTLNHNENTNSKKWFSLTTNSKVVFESSTQNCYLGFQCIKCILKKKNTECLVGILTNAKTNSQL
jgi:hypothetical protein